MDRILLIKLLAIGITIFYIIRNDERNSNWIGGVLATTFGLTLFGSGTLTSIAFILYELGLITALYFALFKKIKSENRKALSIFLMLAIINSLTLLLHLPNYWIFYALAMTGTLLYVYLQLKSRTVNVLAVTSIPVVDFILTISKLVG